MATFQGIPTEECDTGYPQTRRQIGQGGRPTLANLTRAGFTTQDLDVSSNKG